MLGRYPLIIQKYSSIFPIETAEKIKDIILSEASDHRICEVSRKLVLGLVTENENKIAAKLAEIAAIYNFVLGKIRYTPDPIGIELVYHPKRMFELFDTYGSWAGDCDDMALLCGTLLHSIGHPVLISIVAFDNSEEYSHIFVQSWVEGKGWIVVDPSMDRRDNQKIEAMLLAITKIKNFEVRK